MRDVAAPAAVLWEVVAGIGGPAGWYAADRLWRLRASADRVLGGPGMRGRPAGPLRVGDAVDFWRVEEVQAPHRLLLRAEMRLPGTARLELTVEPRGSGSRLVQRTGFEPRGPVGHAFWWAELPAHRAVFARMCDGLASRAEQRAPGG